MFLYYASCKKNKEKDRVQEARKELWMSCACSRQPDPCVCTYHFSQTQICINVVKEPLGGAGSHNNCPATVAHGSGECNNISLAFKE